MAQGITGYFDIGDSTYNPSRFKLRVHYSESYDVSANQSTVSVTKLQLMSTTQYSWVGVTYYPNGAVSVGDKTVVTCSSTQGTHSVYIGSRDVWTDISGTLGSTTISHNSDGSGSAYITVSLRLITSSGGAGSGAIISGNTTVNLTNIPRASVPSVSGDAICGSALTILTNRANTAFTHTLRYAFGALSGTIAMGVGASYAWTIPYDLAKQIRDAVTGQGKIYCDTYNDSNLIGTESVAFTLKVPDNDITKPTIDGATFLPLWNGTMPPVFDKKYVQGKTSMIVRFTPQSTYSTVKSCTLTIEGLSYSGESVTTAVLSVSGRISFVYTVTDVRGYSRQYSDSVYVYPYQIPYLADFICKRTNASYTDDSGGLYIYLHFVKHFSDVDGDNSCVVYRRHRVQGGSYGAWTRLNEDGAYDYLVPGITTDPEMAYQVQLLLEDTVGAFKVYTVDIPSQFHTIHLRDGGKGIAFGKSASQDGFDCAMDAKFEGAVVNKHDLNLGEIKTGTFSVVVPTANAYHRLTANNVTGDFPTSHKTVFTVISQSDALNHFTQFSFDNSNVSNLGVYSTVAQRYTVFWVSF